MKVSSVCPRLKPVAAQARIEAFNAGLAALCIDKQCEFVNNDNVFKTMDGNINVSLLQDDNVHLNVCGSTHLLKTLGLAAAMNLKSNVSRHTNMSDIAKTNRKSSTPYHHQHKHISNHSTHQSRQQTTRNQKDDYTEISRSRRPRPGRQDHPQGTSCYQCGENHSTKDCMYGSRVTCFRCGHLGHKVNRCNK